MRPRVDPGALCVGAGAVLIGWWFVTSAIALPSVAAAPPPPPLALTPPPSAPPSRPPLVRPRREPFRASLPATATSKATPSAGPPNVALPGGPQPARGAAGIADLTVPGPDGVAPGVRGAPLGDRDQLVGTAIGRRSFALVQRGTTVVLLETGSSYDGIPIESIGPHEIVLADGRVVVAATHNGENPNGTAADRVGTAVNAVASPPESGGYAPGVSPTRAMPGFFPGASSAPYAGPAYPPAGGVPTPLPIAAPTPFNNVSIPGLPSSAQSSIPVTGAPAGTLGGGTPPPLRYP